MAFISDLIGQRIDDKLTLELITNQPDPDKRPTIIRQGLFQANPAKARIGITINPGDPEDTSSAPAWADTAAADKPEPGYRIPITLVGGGSFWWRRFTIEITVYLVTTQEDRDQSRALAGEILGSVENALREDGVIQGPADQFGERAILLNISKSVQIEGGGPPRSHIWRHKIFLAVLTEKL